MRGRKGFPRCDCTSARLSGGEGNMNRMLNGMIYRVNVKVKKCSNPGSNRWAEMRDMIFFVLVETHAFHERDLNLVGDNYTSQQIGAALAALLRDGY